MADRTATGTLTVQGLIERLKAFPQDAAVHLDTHSNWQYINADEVTFDAAEQVVTIESTDPHADDEDDE